MERKASLSLIFENMKYMINKILILSYYHPWISGGGHRPVCLLEQDLAKDRDVVFLFESKAEIEEIVKFSLSNHPNLKLIMRDKENGILFAYNRSAKRIIPGYMDDSKIFSVWKPDYIRSHNPVRSFIPLLELGKELNIPIIYDQMDYWDGFSVKPWGDDTETQYMELATRCITISNWLASHTVSKAMHIIPNALKPNFLEDIRLKEIDEIIKRYQKKDKTVLYTGAIWPDWFDWDIVRYIVKKRLKYKFVFVGPFDPSSDEDDGRQISEIVKELSKLPNVSFLGQVSHSELAPLLKSAHVGIIPFVVNPVTEACSPLKCFEYIGAYLPIVSTNLPEIKDYPLVSIANNCDEFLIALDNCVNLKIETDIIYEVEVFLRQSTWDKRSDDFDKVAIKAMEEITVSI